MEMQEKETIKKFKTIRKKEKSLKQLEKENKKALKKS